MKKISAVIITFNEEKNIKRCLDSLNNVADEIVVVDSFSTDKTEEICSEYKNVSFYQNPFTDYSQQKNYANSLAKNEFILSIDADEAISPELKNSILEEKEKGFPENAYLFSRLVFYCGKKIRFTDWYPDVKLRLWKKEIGKWEGALHENVQLNQNIKPFLLKGALYHYTFHTIAQHIAQINKFTEIGAEVAFKKNKKVSLPMIYLKSEWKFISSYFLRLGFLDGYYGYVICRLSAQATFIKYIKLRELNKNSGAN